jgi:RNA polymerase sigma-70 factor (ECF subfamily)
MNNLATFNYVKIDNDELTRIVRLAMDGDEIGFEELVNAFSKYILSFVGNLVINKEETEDAAQEVVLQIFRSIGTLQSPYAFTSWLRRLMLFVVDDYNDKNSRHVKNRADFTEELAETLESHEESPYEQALRADKNEAVNRIIAELPKVQRTSIYLYYYENLSYKEIAKLLGVSIVTVGTNIKKAKANLKKMMNSDKLIMEAVVGAFTLNSQTFVTDGAIESLKIYAHTMDKLAINRPEFIAKLSESKIWARALATVGGVAVIAVVVLAFALSPDKPAEIPKEAPPVNEPIEISYSAEGSSIDFVTDSTFGPNVDPVSAHMELAPDDKDSTVIGWRILEADGAELASGNGADMTIPELAPGKYSLEYSAAKSGVAIGKVTRTFHIT